MKKIIDNIIYILTAILLTTIVLLKDKYFIMLCLAAGGLIIIGILLFINKNSYALINFNIFYAFFNFDNDIYDY